MKSGKRKLVGLPNNRSTAVVSFSGHRILSYKFEATPPSRDEGQNHARSFATVSFQQGTLKTGDCGVCIRRWHLIHCLD